MNLQMCICPWMLVWAKLLASTLLLLETQITSFDYEKWIVFQTPALQSRKGCSIDR